MSNPNVNATRVIGTAVYGPDNEKLGSLCDLIIDKRSGVVSSALLEHGGLLGIGSETHPLSWNALVYDVEVGGYRVGAPIDELKKTDKRAADDGAEPMPLAGIASAAGGLG